jgi:LacI family transcriptional regulator
MSACRVKGLGLAGPECFWNTRPEKTGDIGSKILIGELLMEKRITQNDIAKALNIGINTVNRAFNNTGYVSKEMKKKIFEYSHEVNYVVNKAAQSLVRAEIRTIALFSSEKPKFFWDDIQKGVDIAKKHFEPFNINVLYIRIPVFDDRAYIKKLEEVLDDGVQAIGIVNNSEYDIPKICSIIEAHDVPYLTFNIDAPSSKRICYIGPDYLQGGKLAANFLGVGLQDEDRILVLTSDSDRFPGINEIRLSGFQDTLAEYYPGINCVIRKLNEKDSPDAIQTKIKSYIEEEGGNYSGIYLISCFCSELIQVLSDNKCITLSPIVVVHDLFPGYKEYFNQKLITALIYQNPILQGYEAVKILEHILNHEDKTGREDVLLHSSILLRENCESYTNHYVFAQFEIE